MADEALQRSEPHQLARRPDAQAVTGSLGEEPPAAELPRTQFDPQARRQYALELAALMGKVELLLSTLRRQERQGTASSSRKTR